MEESMEDSAQENEPDLDRNLDERKKRHNKGPVICEVTGCEAACNLYTKRFRVCSKHLKAEVIIVSGRRMRFCQQHNRFQPVADFFGKQRNCIASLQARKQRGIIKRTGKKTPHKMCSRTSRQIHGRNKAHRNSALDRGSTTAMGLESLESNVQECSSRQTPFQDSAPKPGVSSSRKTGTNMRECYLQPFEAPEAGALADQQKTGTEKAGSNLVRKVDFVAGNGVLYHQTVNAVDPFVYHEPVLSEHIEVPGLGDCSPCLYSQPGESQFQDQMGSSSVPLCEEGLVSVPDQITSTRISKLSDSHAAFVAEYGLECDQGTGHGEAVPAVDDLMKWLPKSSGLLPTADAGMPPTLQVPLLQPEETTPFSHGFGVLAKCGNEHPASGVAGNHIAETPASCVPENMVAIPKRFRNSFPPAWGVSGSGPDLTWPTMGSQSDSWTEFMSPGLPGDRSGCLEALRSSKPYHQLCVPHCRSIVSDADTCLPWIPMPAMMNDSAFLDETPASWGCRDWPGSSIVDAVPARNIHGKGTSQSNCAVELWQKYSHPPGGCGLENRCCSLKASAGRLGSANL